MQSLCTFYNYVATLIVFSFHCIQSSFYPTATQSFEYTINNSADYV